ncbi:MAG TPA: transposase [Roseiflexaceae bacterium]|nr:transposase [Roseiflexaceae bacterium]HMP40600.1 transposase [Roseiflexaceae bacterium]
MRELFDNRYRIASARLPGWDYSAGWYFITVCTRGREPWLSTVVGDKVQLSLIGAIVVEEWQRTASLRPNVTLDAWVAMPDHFHAIIAIHLNAASAPTDASDLATNPVDTDHHVETPRRGVSTPPPSPPSPFAAPTLRAGLLGAIVGQWKSAATKRIRADHCADFAWQSRFYDVIIRDAAMLAQLRRYIAEMCRIR